MKKILKTYETLNIVRAELKQLEESIKDDPLKQLKSYAQTSSLSEDIYELRKQLLKEAKKYLQTKEDEESVKLLARLEEIDNKSEQLTVSTRSITSENGHSTALNYLKSATQIQADRNELIEDIITSLKTPSIKVKTKKKKI